MSTERILITHAIVVSLLLLFWLWRLRQQGLFHWRTAGFWAWAAFLLYYVVNPLGSLLTDELLRYDLALAIAGGEQRALRIGLVACVGISVFFLVYLRTHTRPVTWGLASSSQFTPAVWFFLLACIAAALPSLIIYRAGAFGGTENVLIEQGHFIGNVTGYQYSGHMLLLVPRFIWCCPNPFLAACWAGSCLRRMCFSVRSIRGPVTWWSQWCSPYR